MKLCCDEYYCTGGFLPSLLALCWLMQFLSIITLLSTIILTVLLVLSHHSTGHLAAHVLRV